MSIDKNIEKRAPFVSDDSDIMRDENWFLSLSKLYGKGVKDIVVSISGEFGEPVLAISQIVFDDGTKIGVGGEHDIAYIENYRSSPSPVVDLMELDDYYGDEG